MLTPPGEIGAALRGAWRLARADARGLSEFNATIAGFWRSFLAAVLCAPAYILILTIDHAQQPPSDASDGRLIAVHAIAYVIRWTAFPLAMTSVARALGRESAYTLFIVASNWASVLKVMLLLPVFALAASGIAPFGMLPLLATIAVLLYQWFIARRALDITGTQAAAVVGLDLMIDLAVTTAVRALLDVGA